jgi:transcriptional regulator with XRE-family HTH domain
MTSKEPSIGMQKRLLGQELRRLRQPTGLTQAEASSHLGKAANKVSRAETGKTGMDKSDLDVLLNLYKASEKDRLWCHELARTSRSRPGRKPGESTLYLGPKWFRAFRDLETSATEIMIFRSEIITGIFQTETYIRAMFVAQGFDPDDEEIGNTVRVRAERRDVLTRDNPPTVNYVLSESALRRQIGGRKVMAEQLHYLATMARLPNVTIQVIPFDTQSYQHLGSDFTVFRFDQNLSNDIAYLELYNDAAILPKPVERVREYADLFARLRGIALGPVESRNFILGLADQFAATSTPS